MNILNKIYLRRCKKVMLQPLGVIDTRSFIHIATIIKNLESLGFLFSEKLIDSLKTYPTHLLEEFYIDILPQLKKMVGADVKYEPMYPNFPKQVMEASDCELFINAIVHYLTFGKLLPQYEKEARFPLITFKTHTILDVGSTEDFLEMTKNIIGAKTSISQEDKDDYKVIFEKTPTMIVLPEKIYMKENLAFISNLYMQKHPDDIDGLKEYYKTATDVLRLAVAMSDGDISLSTDTKYRNFTRKERRFLLELLENTNKRNIKEDMLRHKQKWLRLGEKLHPGDYKNQFSFALSGFQALRENEKIETFNSKVEKLLKICKNKNLFDFTCFMNLLNLLKTRPAELTRRLNELMSIDIFTTTNFFVTNKIAESMETPMLLQLYGYLKNRNEKLLGKYRVFFPKAITSKAFVKENKLNKIAKAVQVELFHNIEQTMIKKYKEKSPLENIYIDPTLEGYLIPFSQRSANKALKTIVRGSNFKLRNDTQIVRSFVYWKNGTTDYENDRIDLDLSAAMFDNDWKNIGSVSYRALRNNYAIHSGDITNAPNGASEFIDINLNDVPKNVRYIVFNVFSYTRQTYDNMPIAFTGFMERNETGQKGEIFEPSFVKNKFDLNGDTAYNIPFILDCKERKYIWADLATKNKIYSGGNNVESNLSSMSLMGIGLTSLCKPNLYDLFKLHAEGRGLLVDKIEEADICFIADENRDLFDEIEKNTPKIMNKTIIGKLGEIVTTPIKVPRKIITQYNIEKIISEYI